MKIDKVHCGKLAATLKLQGCSLIGYGQLIHHHGFYGEEYRGGEYELAMAEESARDVLAAIEAYRQATKPEPVKHDGWDLMCPCPSCQEKQPAAPRVPRPETA